MTKAPKIIASGTQGLVVPKDQTDQASVPALETGYGNSSSVEAHFRASDLNRVLGDPADSFHGAASVDMSTNYFSLKQA